MEILPDFKDYVSAFGFPVCLAATGTDMARATIKQANGGTSYQTSILLAKALEITSLLDHIDHASVERFGSAPLYVRRNVDNLSMSYTTNHKNDNFKKPSSSAPIQA